VTATCGHCRHFDGEAAAFERALPGIRALSSALAAVRGDDGRCRLHDRIVRPMAACAHFDGKPATADAIAPAAPRWPPLQSHVGVRR
jgi:hypothetical protein